MDDALRYALEEFESIEPPSDLWERITRRSPVAEPTPARRRSPRLAAAAVVCALLAVAAIAGVIASRHGRGPASAIPAAPTLPTDLRPGSIGGDGNYPAPRYALDQLAAVSSASSADAWLVGAKPLPSPSGRRPLAWHWDGHRWTDVAVTIADQRSAFTAVTTVSADDAWAVGVTSDNGADQYGRPLVMHWNGRAWRPAAMPGVASGVLYGVDAVDPDDVWAVGGTGTGYRMRAPLVEHWDGTRWTRVPLPELGAGAGALVTVDAVAANDVWIANAPSGGSTRSVVLHWDGVRLVRLPDPFGARDPAASITAVSATDAWAVGSYVDHPRCANAHTLPLAAHWDGRRWARVAPALAGTDTARAESRPSAPGTCSRWAPPPRSTTHPTRATRARAGSASGIAPAAGARAVERHPLGDRPGAGAGALHRHPLARPRWRGRGLDRRLRRVVGHRGPAHGWRLARSAASACPRT